MKSLSILLLLLAAFSCRKTIDKEPKLESCDFGITKKDLGTFYRPPVSDEEMQTVHHFFKGRKPKVTGLPVILLDFDGHRVHSKYWNGGKPFDCANANMTAAEMQRTIDSVTIDYSLWQVIVTTDEAIYNAAPTNRRTRVIFTTTWEWYGKAGGVAYLNSFSWGDETPCFVFTSLLNYNTKYILEAAAHEAGHTVNLPHAADVDLTNGCVVLREYKYGPNIMGVAYTEPLSYFGTAVYSPYCSIVNQLTTIDKLLNRR